MEDTPVSLIKGIIGNLQRLRTRSNCNENKETSQLS